MSDVLTFKEVAERCRLRRRSHTVDPRTMRSNVAVLSVAFGTVPITAIDLPMIEAWMSARLDAGVSRATLNRNRSALSVILDFAIAEGLRPGPNPVRQTRSYREGVGRTRYLSTEEANRFMLAASPHLKFAMMLALHTAGRRKEILSLRWEDIDTISGFVCFRRETTKGLTTRYVPISEGLAAYLKGQPRGRPDEHVITYMGRPIRSLRASFENAREKAGLGHDVVLHSLRHTAASWFRQRGGELADLQEILGHTDISLTRRYAHLSPEQQRARARFLGPPPRKAKAPADEESEA